MPAADVFDDLEAEQDRLEEILGALSPVDWLTPSAAAGWTVADTMLHLAQTEEAVAAALGSGPQVTDWRRFGDTVDGAMAAMVEAEPSPPAEIFERWRSARRRSVLALRNAGPDPVPWVAAALKPRTLATTRLAEHWAHALDITGPLGIDLPDTARLHHIAWLGHGTLRYAFGAAGLPPTEIHRRLTAPDGSTWTFGDPAASSSISGAAGAFCRVGAQRLAPAASGLLTTGKYGEKALRLLRNYAM